MKNIITILLITVASNFAFAQDIAKCESIVLQTYDAINKQNADPIMKYLSNDFSIAGQTGEIAKMVLPQLFNQLNMQVSNIKKVSETKTDVLTLIYEADFGEKGNKQSTFVFNNKNQLQKLDLIKMEVMATEGDASVVKSEEPYFTVPFKRVGNLISVEAKLNGVVRTFLVDNGAPILVLNNTHIVKDTTLKKLTVSSAEGVGGKITNMDIEKVENFELGGITMDTQKVVSMDLAHLEEGTKTTFYGLIGYEIYKDYDLLFDYKKNTLTFIKPEATEDFIKNNYSSKKQIEVPLEMQGHLAVVNGFVNGKKYSLGIDCGAETNTFDFSVQGELIKSLGKLKADTLAGANKNVVTTVTGKLRSLQIGTVDFRKTETVFSDMTQLNKGYNIKLDGLIGFDILSNQPTLISYKNKKVVFLK